MSEFVGLILFLVALVVVSGLVYRPRRSHYRRKWNYSSHWKTRTNWRPENNVTPFVKPLERRDLADVGQQLHAVMAGSFEKQRLMTPSEYRVFAIIENEVATHQSGYRIFAQTSLGEILRSSSQDAYSSINSKRVDILVVDRGGWPYLAVEFQGDGHYQGTAAARDAVKREALRKAGVRYIEFNASDTEEKIRSRIREHFVVQGPWTQNQHYDL